MMLALNHLCYVWTIFGLQGSGQAEATKTLYLMSPSYTSVSDAASAGVVINSKPAISTAHRGIQSDYPEHHQQQQNSWLALPSTTVSPCSVSQQFNIVAMPNPSLRNQNSASAVFTDGVNKEQGYSWNEFSFRPSSDMEGEDAQVLASRLGTNDHQVADLFHLGRLRVLHQPSSRDQDALNSSSVAVGLESWQSSSGNTLSLSLSPQQPAVVHLKPLPIQGVSDCSGLSNNTGTENISSKGERLLDRVSDCSGERLLDRVDGSLSSFRVALRDDIMQMDLENCSQGNMVASAATIELYSFKYLKAAQLLLNEVVSVARGIERGSLNNEKATSWMGPNSSSEDFIIKEKKSMEVNALQGTSAASWGSCVVKDGGVHAISFVPANDGIIPEQNPKIVVDLTLAERQELQMKKTKLLAMLDKVNRQYQQYRHQLQLVVGSFESVAGLGAAQTYTALALQAISKHFRCLKDAIRGQIRVSCRSLGEEDASGLGKNGTSRLQLIDQQLRQQRALQQLGVVQQPAWRPQRGLPERAVSILRAWLFEHFLHPYPKDSDKHFLARQAGLTRNQVSNWFINARVRLWKPMVEEMYAEEIKEDEGDSEAEELHKAAKDQENLSHQSNAKDGRGNNLTINVAKKEKMHYTAEDVGQFSNPKMLYEYPPEMVQSNTMAGNLSGSFLCPQKESMSQGIKRARSADGAQGSLASLLSSYNGTCMETNPSDEVHDIMKVHRVDGHMGDYNIPHHGLAQIINHQNLGAGYGSSDAGGLNGYPHEASQAAIGRVSLTLGLQEIGGLSQVLTSSSSSGICKVKESSCRW